jgi:hypothetical protein
VCNLSLPSHTLDMIILIIFYEQEVRTSYETLIRSLHPHSISSLVITNVILCTLFSSNHVLRSGLKRPCFTPAQSDK